MSTPTPGLPTTWTSPEALTLLTWADTTPSGGNTYNRELSGALRELGMTVDVVRVPGTWPDPRPADLAALESSLHGRRTVLVDGIVGCAAPGRVRRAVAAGAEVHLLVHMPLAAEVGLSATEQRQRARTETRALRYATGIICPSHETAGSLRARGHAATVALPGTRPAPPAPGSDPTGPPQLLCLGALTPTKDQLTLVRALAALTDLPWQARLVGPHEPRYVEQVRAAVDRGGLTDRVELTGALTGTALERVWSGTDLLLLPSRTETYGLVVTEALAHGIPAVVSAGTGAVEALGAGTSADRDARPGRAVPAGDAPAWSRTLRAWLLDADLRLRWRQAARDARERLPRWTTTAQAVRAALTVPAGERAGR